MSLSEDLTWRGLIKDTTFAGAGWLDKPRTFYHGIDASADSLTVGNLAALLLARRLADEDWQPVLLVGGGTSLVGDPGGKASERQLMRRQDVERNIEALKFQLKQLFSGQKFKLVDNHDWLDDLKYLDFLRDVGKHFSMSELMQRDFVTERLREGGSGISYAEFSYSLVQGYDFWHLFKHHNVVLQIGGSDQWGNMLSGVSLIRKKENAEAHALSMPLVVNKVTGTKFGKSETGAIWLDPSKTSPAKFYQFWINTDDDDVEDYLKFFTFLSHSQIKELMDEQASSPGARKAQIALADEVTKLVHGTSGGSSASIVTAYLNGNKSIAKASLEDIEELRAAIPHLTAKAGASIVELLVASGLAASNSEARRLLASKAIYINNRTADTELMAAVDFEGGRALLRRGKAYKDSALIEHE